MKRFRFPKSKKHAPRKYLQIRFHSEWKEVMPIIVAEKIRSMFLYHVETEPRKPRKIKLNALGWKKRIGDYLAQRSLRFYQRSGKPEQKHPIGDYKEVARKIVEVAVEMSGGSNDHPLLYPDDGGSVSAHSFRTWLAIILGKESEADLHLATIANPPYEDPKDNTFMKELEQI